MDSTTAYNGLGKDATVCANEYGVTMLMSITSFSNAAALKADPLVEAGLSEFTAVDLVVCQSATAREAVEVLFNLIDVYGSSEVNIALIYPDLPADMSCVTWESTGPALYGVFVPVSNGAQSISEPYSRNQSAENARTFDTQQYPYYRFKALCTLGVEKNDYTIYGLPVRTYWHDAESIMTQEMPEILKTAAGMDEAAAKQYITDYCNAMQDQAFTDAGQILNDVLWYRSRNSNTMKNGRNPETHEILDERAAVDPLKVSLDPAAYHFVPPMPDQR